MMALFVAGGLLGALDSSPFRELADGARDTGRFVAEMRQVRPDILEATSDFRSGIVVHDPQRAQEGYTLIQGLLPGGPQVRLIDMDGKEVHRWNIDFFDIWTDPIHVVPQGNLPKSTMHYHTQGFWPLSDGSIVANFAGLGVARLDQCGEPIWSLDRMGHHSVTPTEDGKYWIPGHISVYETPEDLLPTGIDADQIARGLVGTLKNYNNSLMLVDSNGEVEKEFSVLQAMVDAKLEHALYSSLTEVLVDPTHINDIEIVTPALANKIEDVVAGDLLVSVREMHMLAIFDQNDGHLKWYRQGNWVRQHDIDITPDGNIEIFNNRSRAIGNWVNGSQILTYDPTTDGTNILLPIGPEDNFYSWIMGTHQSLDNGNRLIAEALAGRSFEVTPQGDVVWEFRMPYDDETASLFEMVMRVPYDYFESINWTCEE
jgi:hypothetical protein